MSDHNYKLLENGKFHQDINNMGVKIRNLYSLRNPINQSDIDDVIIKLNLMIINLKDYDSKEDEDEDEDYKYFVKMCEQSYKQQKKHKNLNYDKLNSMLQFIINDDNNILTNNNNNNNNDNDILINNNILISNNNEDNIDNEFTSEDNLFIFIMCIILIFCSVILFDIIFLYF